MPSLPLKTLSCLLTAIPCTDKSIKQSAIMSGPVISAKGFFVGQGKVTCRPAESMPEAQEALLTRSGLQIWPATTTAVRGLQRSEGVWMSPRTSTKSV